MNNLGIIIDNTRAIYENKLIFETLNKIYEEDKSVSIDLFIKNTSWPYKPIEYGVFKLLDYQNFRGPTISFGIEFLNILTEIPHNNEVCLYLNNFPSHPNISGLVAINLLTQPNLMIYCRNKDIQEFMLTFNKNSFVCSSEELIRKKLCLPTNS